MDNGKLSAADHRIFLLASLIWLGFLWLGFVLTLGGVFYAWIVWLTLAAGGIALAYHLYRHRISVRPSLEMAVVGAALLFVVILFSYFSTPTVFSGRDQGAISEAAVRLTQNHTLEFSTPASAEFFKIYGQGRALNFPGFHYTEGGGLITQFPLIYTVWLALFYALSGTAGFTVANAVLLYIFFLSFHMLLRLFVGARAALPTILFAATSFVFMWFSKFTLSENMALPLLWLGILALMLFLERPGRTHYAVFLAAMILLFFTRIEGIAFLAVSIAVISLDKKSRDYVRERPATRFFLPAGIFLAAFILNAVRDMNFYREIAKALLPDLAAPQAQSLGALKSAGLPDFYTGKIFYLYGLLGFFIAGAAGVIVHFRKKEFRRLVPFFIILPTSVYFFDAYITPDHPWMLRRFMFSLLPAAIFYSGLLIGRMLEKKAEGGSGKLSKLAGGALAVILVLGNLPTFSEYLPFSENEGLPAQTRTLGDRFSSDDLVLVDRETTGNGWTMISGPLGFLYGKNAVYFFNTNDLAKLDLEKFDKVYLIAPDKQVPYYLDSTIGDRLAPAGVYSLTFPEIDMDRDDRRASVSLPAKKTTVANGKIFEIAK